MSFGAIQFGGLASGLDTASIIQALLAVEQRSIGSLQQRKSEENNKLSLIGTLEGLIKGVKNKADDLSGSDGFYAHNVSLSNEGYLSATLDGTALAGTHEISVDSLAQAARFHSSSVSDSAADLGTGSISFDYQSQTYNVDITDVDASSLADVRDAINEQVGDKVTATVINTGTENSPSYELILNALNTGADHEIENLSVSGDLATSGGLGFTRLQDALDAEFTFDGIEILRSTNVISDLLDGYEFTLEQEHASGDSTIISAELDTDGSIDNLQGLVDEYNAVIEFVNKQNAYSEDNGPGGALFGDSLLSQVRSTIYNGLFNVDVDAVQADTAGFASLGLVGFDVGTDGTISIDRDKMAEKLTEDGAAFTNLLTGDVDFGDDTVSGAFGKLVSSIESLIDDQTTADGDSIDGIFGSRRDSIKDRIELFDDQIQREEYRLERVEEGLVAKFSALESLLAGLQSQQAFLNG